MNLHTEYFLGPATVSGVGIMRGGLDVLLPDRAGRARHPLRQQRQGFRLDRREVRLDGRRPVEDNVRALVPFLTSH